MKISKNIVTKLISLSLVFTLLFGSSVFAALSDSFTVQVGSGNTGGRLYGWCGSGKTGSLGFYANANTQYTPQGNANGGNVVSVKLTVKDNKNVTLYTDSDSKAIAGTSAAWRKRVA